MLDTGIGLSKEQQIKIFEPFTQGDISTTRKYGGTGLGLSLSRQLVELMGGELSVKSAPGQGSRFEFDIKLAGHGEVIVINSQDDIPRSDEIVHASMEQIVAKGHVLIVDDTQDNQNLFGLLLNKMGIETSVANNGQEAVDKVTAAPQRYNLILMDMHMPVMDGYTAVEYLRREAYTIPIIAVTADAMASHRERCIAMGCNGFLTKPISRDDLMTIVTRFLVPEQGYATVNSMIESSLLAEGPEFNEVVNDFLCSLPEKHEKIMDAINGGNRKQIAFELHTLKGVAANLGYPELAEYMLEMETTLENDAGGRLVDYVPALDALIKRMLMAIV